MRAITKPLTNRHQFCIIILMNQKRCFNIGAAVIFSIIFIPFFTPALAWARPNNKTKISSQDQLFKKEVTTKKNEAIRTILNGTALESGLTLEASEQEFSLGITPNSLGERPGAQVILKELKPKELTAFNLENEKLLSGVFSFEITHKKKIKVHQPLWLSLKWNQETTEQYVIKYWDGDEARWVDLVSVTKLAEQKVQASIGRASAIVGIFEQPQNVLAGVASWYDWYGAAMNDLPIGTEIKVTNPENGKSATTKVVSTGPFTSGRLIDLPRDIFAAIGNIWDGVMTVVVEIVMPTS